MSNMEWFKQLLAILATISVSQCYSIANEKVSYRNNTLYYVEGEPDPLIVFRHCIYGIGVDNYSYNGNSGTYVYAVVPPKFVAGFEGCVKKSKNPLNVTILSKDYQTNIDNEKAIPGRPFSWTAYYDVPDIYAFLHNLSSRYPQIATVVEAGLSYEGRSIMGMRIDTGCDEKPAFFIESGIHAREWIAPAVATYFINQLLTSTDPQIVCMRDQFDWYIFPSVNPDGYHYSYTKDRFWRKSRSLSPSGCHGVDLNRNWDTENWLKYSASNDSCDYYTFAGTKPFSEPETRSLSQYVANITNLQVYASIHSDSHMLLIPFSGTMKRPHNYADLIKIGKSSLAYGAKVNVSSDKYIGPAPAGKLDYMSSGESMDWAKRSLKVPLAYTYELRGELLDWPPSEIYQQGDEFTQMMLGLVVKAKKLGYFKKFKNFADAHCFN